MEVQPITWIGVPALYFVVCGIVQYENTIVPPTFAQIGVVAFEEGQAKDVAKQIAFRQPSTVESFKITQCLNLGNVHGIAESVVTGR